MCVVVEGGGEMVCFVLVLVFMLVCYVDVIWDIFDGWDGYVNFYNKVK